MNTATRALPQSRFATSLPIVWIKQPRRVNLILMFIVLLLAFAVIYLKDVNRRLFIEQQHLQMTHDKLYEDWGKLLLEQSTWGREGRVHKIAQQRLGMHTPQPTEILILRRH